MNWGQVGRAALVALLVLLPALVYAKMRSDVRRRREAAVARAGAEQKAWSNLMIERSATAAGLEPGRPFPRLPVEPSTAQQEIMLPGRPTVVLMVHSLLAGENQEQLRGLRQIVEERPGIALFLVTSESQRMVARQNPSLAHPRIRYARALGEYLDRLQVFGDPVVYDVDGSGIIRRRRVFPLTFRYSTATAPFDMAK